MACQKRPYLEDGPSGDDRGDEAPERNSIRSAKVCPVARTALEAARGAPLMARVATFFAAPAAFAAAPTSGSSSAASTSMLPVSALCCALARRPASHGGSLAPCWIFRRR